MLPESFDGYPYLCTRIGHSSLRNITLLPTDWSIGRLVDVAVAQAAANQMQVCLCLGAGDGLFVDPDGTRTHSGVLPIGPPVAERLLLPAPIPETPELADRHELLEAYVRAYNATGYLVGDGLERGRSATRDDIGLKGHDANGIPIGLARCSTCGQYRGDYLALKGEGNGDKTPRVIRVHCACENHNRCARCGQPLAHSRLSAYEFNEEDGKVWYAAAYMGLSHRCAA
jgi:hypothetical protein